MRTNSQREMGRGGDIQDKDNMFARYVPFTSIWAIASRGRTYLDRLSLAPSLAADAWGRKLT
jgi:hypothetical protein